MRHHLTDFDYAVLAALKIGALKRQGDVWLQAGVNVMPSLFRLEQAGELYISIHGAILFPGTAEYREAERREELIVTLKRGIRDGSIKLLVDKSANTVSVIKKGTKP